MRREGFMRKAPAKPQEWVERNEGDPPRGP
jgi:hypothetical protein